MTERPPSNRLAFATRAIHAGQHPIPRPAPSCRRSTRRRPMCRTAPASTRATNIPARRTRPRQAYERCIADLESGTRGFAFASGLAAIATVLDLLDSGDMCWRQTISMAAPFGCSTGSASARRGSTSPLRFHRPALEAAIRPDTQDDLGRNSVQSAAEADRPRRDRGARETARHPHRGRQHLRQPLSCNGRWSTASTWSCIRRPNT